MVAPFAGTLVNRVGERPLIVGGLLLQAAGMAWIALIAAPGLPYWHLVAPLIARGCRRLDGDARGTERGDERGRAQPRSARPRAPSTCSAISAACSGSRSSPRCSPGRAASALAHAFSAGFTAAIGVAAALSLLGAVAGMWQPSAGESAFAPADAKA